MPDTDDAPDRDDAPRPTSGPGERPRRETTVRELLTFLPDVVRLLGRLVRDDRVPWQSKVLAGAALAYLVSPVDVIPDVVPVLGQADDLWLAVRAVRSLMRTAGYDVVHEHWSGSDDGFALLLVVAGIER
ncbi:MAG: YkvA family protein [Actinomycetes bacterium]